MKCSLMLFVVSQRECRYHGLLTTRSQRYLHHPRKVVSFTCVSYRLQDGVDGSRDFVNLIPCRYYSCLICVYRQNPTIYLHHPRKVVQGLLGAMLLETRDSHISHLPYFTMYTDLYTGMCGLLSTPIPDQKHL